MAYWKGDDAMLVLSRHRDESIIIGDDIKITVVEIRGDKVRIGVAAPIAIPVHREEVYEAIQREIKAARKEAEKQSLEGLDPSQPGQSGSGGGTPPPQPA